MISNRAILLAQTALIIGLAGAVLYLGRDEIPGLLGGERDAAPARAAEDADGRPDLRVRPAVQKASGIETGQPKPYRLQPGLPMQGVVVDLRTLIELRARLRTAAGEIEAQRAAAGRSDAEYRRVRALYEDERNASERAVQAAQAERAAAQARLGAAEATHAALREELRQEWGPELARWADASQAPQLKRLLEGEDVLLRMNLRPGERAPSEAGRLEIDVAGAERRRATLVSAAPRTDPGLPGATYFYRVSARGLRIGERVSGHLLLGAKEIPGVIVPATALVWHGGKAWVYVQEAEDRFERREVSTAEPVGDGWFNSSLNGEQRIVLRGAQLLLSEEFRWQITNENED